MTWRCQEFFSKHDAQTGSYPLGYGLVFATQLGKKRTAVLWARALLTLAVVCKETGDAGRSNPASAALLADAKISSRAIQ